MTTTPSDIEPFKVHVTDEELSELHRRLERTQFPDEVAGAGWDDGMPLDVLRDLVASWRQFDWRAAEKRLNELDHFTTVIDDLRVHFIHQRSKEPGARPLILVHGWPGSFFEFHKVIAPLTDPVAHGGRAEDAFHVVCPSLPGYGFSEAPREKGFGIRRIATTFASLMRRLGYGGYVAQGGDFGFHVARFLGADGLPDRSPRGLTPAAPVGRRALRRPAVDPVGERRAFPGVRGAGGPRSRFTDVLRRAREKHFVLDFGPG